MTFLDLTLTSNQPSLTLVVISDDLPDLIGNLPAVGLGLGIRVSKWGGLGLGSQMGRVRIKGTAPSIRVSG